MFLNTRTRCGFANLFPGEAPLGPRAGLVSSSVLREEAESLRSFRALIDSFVFRNDNWSAHPIRPPGPPRATRLSSFCAYMQIHKRTSRSPKLSDLRMEGNLSL